MKVGLSRLQLATLVLGPAVAPWLRGGRDAPGLMVIYGAVVVASVLAWRLLEVKYVRWTALGVWAGLFLIWAMASYGWSVNRYQTTTAVLVYGLAGMAGLLAYLLAQTKGGRDGLLRVYLGIAAVFSLYGIWLYLAGDYPRLTSTVYWANPFATFLIPAVVICWWRAARGGAGRWYLGLSIVFLTAFSLTYSRAAYLVLGLATVILLVLQPLQKRQWIKFVFIIIASILLTSVVSGLRQKVFQQQVISVSQRFSEAAQGESTSGQDRIYYIRSVGKIFADNPLRGTGAGTFGTVHPSYQLRVISASADAHNVYLQTLSELGLAGGILIAGVMLSALVGLWRFARKQPRYLPAVIGTLAVLVHLGLDIGASFPTILTLAAILIGLLYQPKVARPKSRHFHVYWVLAGLLIIGFQPLWAQYQSRLQAEVAASSQDNGELATAADEYFDAHLYLTYNPDTFTGQGINEYAMALAGVRSKVNLASAQRAAEAAIAQDPLDAQHYLLLGRVELAQGNLPEAESNFRLAVALDPYNHPAYYLDLSRLLAEQKQSQAALATSGQILRLYTAEVLINRNLDLDIHHDLANLRLLRAAIYSQTGDTASAEHELEQAKTLDPGNTGIPATRRQLGL